MLDDARVATHEAGHALSAWFSPFVRDIKIISIREPHGGGRTYCEFSNSRYTWKGVRWSMVAYFLGGIAGELTAYKNVRSMNSKQDLKEAFAEATSMAEEGHFRTPWVSEDAGSFQFDIAAMYVSPPAGAARTILNDCHVHNMRIIKENRALFDRVVDRLQKQHVLGPPEIEQLFGKRIKFL